MQVIASAQQLKRQVEEARLRGQRRSGEASPLVSFVPTMGALHDGHISLIRAASGVRVVSIFVNPTQFNSGDDLKKYPRTLQADLDLCKQEGVDLVFTPSVNEIYPKKSMSTTRRKAPLRGRLNPALPVAGATPAPVTDIPVPAIGQSMEGEFRPGHFAGVCAVVKRLFEIVRPDQAFFGEKDFQQVRVIEEMVREQQLPVKIVRCPTVRDKNGLALSSRNARLSPAGYQKALAIPRAIRRVQTPPPGPLPQVEGVTDASLIEIAKTELAGLKVDYVTVSEGRLFIAAWVEQVRLIDNAPLFL